MCTAARRPAVPLQRATPAAAAGRQRKARFGGCLRQHSRCPRRSRHSRRTRHFYLTYRHGQLRCRKLPAREVWGEVWGAASVNHPSAAAGATGRATARAAPTAGQTAVTAVAQLPRRLRCRCRRC
eukprot:354164-Chlamydomonas_euryale.AAC.2